MRFPQCLSLRPLSWWCLLNESASSTADSQKSYENTPPIPGCHHRLARRHQCPRAEERCAQEGSAESVLLVRVCASSRYRRFYQGDWNQGQRRELRLQRKDAREATRWRREV